MAVREMCWYRVEGMSPVFVEVITGRIARAWIEDLNVIIPIAISRLTPLNPMGPNHAVAVS